MTELITLGEFTLQGSDFNRPKLWLLLAYLALEGPCERRFLAELFWQGAADPMTSLRVALAHVRRGLPGTVHHLGQRVSTSMRVDAASVRRQLQTGQQADAVAQYTGAFLYRTAVPHGSTELEEWVYRTRENLADAVVEAHISLGEAAAKLDHHEAAGQHASAAWLLPGTSAFGAEELVRLHSLLSLAQNPLARAVRREAVGYGLRLGSEPVLR